MADDDDLRIEHIIELAQQDIADAVSEKIGRELTEAEQKGICRIVGGEHFWARAEEMQMFIRFHSRDDVLRMIADVGDHYSESHGNGESS